MPQDRDEIMIRFRPHQIMITCLIGRSQGKLVARGRRCDALAAGGSRTSLLRFVDHRPERNTNGRVGPLGRREQRSGDAELVRPPSKGPVRSTIPNKVNAARWHSALLNALDAA
jgi:hypothetical protein